MSYGLSAMPEDDDELMTEAEVAELLTVSWHTVYRLRQSGEGPPWIRVGKRAIRYRRRDVKRWMQRRGQT